MLVTREQDRLAPSKNGHDDSSVDALGEEQSRVRMSSVIEARIPDASPLQKGLPISRVSTAIDCLAIRLREHEIPLDPGGPGAEPFSSLGAALLAKLRHQRHGERHHSSARPRLGLLEDKATAVAHGHLAAG